jgi:acyl carrier protein
MENDANVQAMIDYLKNRVLKNARVEIHKQTSLVSSGLIDSFALVEVLLELEQVTGRRIPAGRVSPRDLETVEQMFLTAERVGKPK